MEEIQSLSQKENEILKIQIRSLEQKILKLQEEIDLGGMAQSNRIKEYEIEIERLDKKLNDEFQERQRMEARIQKVQREKLDYQQLLMKKRRELEEFREAGVHNFNMNNSSQTHHQCQSTNQSEENEDQELIFSLKQQIKELERENHNLRQRQKKMANFEVAENSEESSLLRSENQRLRNLNQELQKRLGRAQQTLVQTKSSTEQTLTQIDTLRGKIEEYAKQIKLFSHESYTENSELERLRIEQQEFLRQIKKLKESTDISHS